jgi:molybdenum transport protein
LDFADASMGHYSPVSKPTGTSESTPCQTYWNHDSTPRKTIMTNTLSPSLDDNALQQLLDEDVRFGDLTTESLAIDSRAGTIRYFARDPMTVCCSEEAARLFALCGAEAEVRIRSGAQAAPGVLLLEATGSAGALHRCWKTAQTLMEWSSGVATSAAEIIANARRADPHAMVAGTRKNTPGTRRLTTKAFRAGGAVMHRLGLSETLLVFAEHRLFLDAEDPTETVARLRRQCPEKRVVVEVSTHAEALAWADCDVLQLEKFTPDGVAEVATALAAAGSTGPAGGRRRGPCRQRRGLRPRRGKTLGHLRPALREAPRCPGTLRNQRSRHRLSTDRTRRRQAETPGARCLHSGMGSGGPTVGRP